MFSETPDYAITATALVIIFVMIMGVVYVLGTLCAKWFNYQERKRLVKPLNFKDTLGGFDEQSIYDEYTQQTPKRYYLVILVVACCLIVLYGVL